MNRASIIVLLLFALTINLFAQSDYEFVQNFKNTTNRLKSKIENATNLNEISSIRNEIRKVKNKYYSKKDFLNKAIYPDKFELIFSDLINSLEKKKNEISKLSKADSEIKKLSKYLNRLSSSYIETINEIENLKSRLTNNDKEIRKYKEKIAYLRKNILLRDSILNQQLLNILSIEKRNFSQSNENDIHNKRINISNGSFISDLKILLNDNIKYLKITDLTSDELFRTLNEQKRLAENLNKLDAEKLSEILRTEDIKRELSEIKSLNNYWGDEILNKIVKGIGKDFRQFGIELNDSSGIEKLYASLLDYLETESVKAGNRYEREHKYKLFNKSVWNGIFKKKWLPGLLKNGLLTNEQIETVNLLLEQWAERNKKSPPILLYILVGVILMLITIYVAAKGKKTKYLRKAVAQKKKNEYDKIKREKEIQKFREKMNKEK